MRVLPIAAVALASTLALTGCRKKAEPQEAPVRWTLPSRAGRATPATRS